MSNFNRARVFYVNTKGSSEEAALKYVDAFEERMKEKGFDTSGVVFLLTQVQQVGNTLVMKRII